MGKMKELQQQIESYADASFKVQREECKHILKKLHPSDRKYLVKQMRGNLKVAINMALNDIKED